MMDDKRLDLNEIIRPQALKFTASSLEDAAERESRLRIEEATALHTRQKEWLVYRLTALILLIAVSLCTWLILNKGLSNDEGKLVLGLLTSIVTGLVGYVTGKASNENKSK